jgi:hypothetical protein
MSFLLANFLATHKMSPPWRADDDHGDRPTVCVAGRRKRRRRDAADAGGNIARDVLMSGRVE